MTTEARLRQYDRLLRLWPSREHPGMWSLDRKTYVGRVGAILPDGLSYRPDAGYRRENGLLHVAYVPAELLDPVTLIEWLRQADTWRHDRPLWARVEDAEKTTKDAQVRARKDGIRYRAGELYESYAWKVKSRVSVPAQIH